MWVAPGNYYNAPSISGFCLLPARLVCLSAGLPRLCPSPAIRGWHLQDWGLGPHTCGTEALGQSHTPGGPQHKGIRRGTEGPAQLRPDTNHWLVELQLAREALAQAWKARVSVQLSGRAATVHAPTWEMHSSCFPTGCPKGMPVCTEYFW